MVVILSLSELVVMMPQVPNRVAVVPAYGCLLTLVRDGASFSSFVILLSGLLYVWALLFPTSSMRFVLREKFGKFDLKD